MSIPNEYNPVTFHKQMKRLLMETNWVENKDVPIAVLYLILKFTASHGQGLQVRLKCAEYQTLFPFIGYDNVLKRTVRVHIPTSNRELPHGLMILPESEIVTKET